MTRRADVELRFTAKDLGTKSLEEINGLLDKVAQQQERLSSTSALAERSLQSFSQEAAAVSAVINTLSRRQQLVDTFKEQGAAAQELAVKVQEARDRLEALRKTQEESGVTGRKLKDALAQPRQELSALERQFNTAERATERAARKLAQFGVDARNATQLDAFGDQIAAGAAKAQAALDRNVASLQGQAAAQAKVQLDAFQRVGTDAEDAAKAIDRASAAVDRFALRQQRRGASAQAVGQILAPDAQQLAGLRGLDTVLSGIEERVNSVTQGAQKNAEKVRALRSEYDRFGEATRRLNDIAALNDRLRQQTEELNRTRQRYQEARQAVASYAQQVQQAGAPNDALRASLERAQASLERLGPQYRRQADALLRTRQAAREAGLSVRDLDANQQRLVGTAQRLTAQQDQVTRSMRALGVEVQKTGQGFAFLEDRGRKTLSFFQRLRGQVLALTAGYFGLFGAVREVNKVIETGVLFQGVEARLRVAAGGDARIFGEELQFVRSVAEELGLELESVAVTYSKFRTATAATNVSVEETRRIFTGIAKAARVLRLDNEQVKGTFFALEQIFSKGKIQAEELRRQLGDRLPGAVATLAASLETTPAIIDKALDRGLLTADNLLLFADEYERRVRDDLPAAQQSFEVSLARLKNRILELRLAVGRGGLLDEIQKLANELISFFDSDAGSEFTQTLAAGARTAGQAFAFLVRNADLVFNIIKAILALQVAKFFFGMGAALTAAAKAGGVLAGALTLVGKGLQALGVAVLAFFAGFQLGNFLFEQSRTVRLVGMLLASAFATIFNNIGIAVEEFKKTFENSFRDLGAEAANALIDSYERVLSGFILPERARDFIGTFIIPVKPILNTVRPEQVELENSFGNLLERIRTRTEKETEAIRREFEDIFDLDEEARRRRAGNKGDAPDAAQTGTPGIDALLGDEAEFQKRVEELREAFKALNIDGADDKAERQALRERERLLEQFAREQVRIETDLLNTQRENLDARLKLIEIEFDERRRLLKQQEDALRDAGLAEQANALAERQQDLQILREINRETAIRQFNEERLKTLQDQINQRLALQKDQLELIALTETDRNVAAERSKKILQESNGEIADLLDQAIALADALGEEGVVASLRRVKAGLAEVNDEGKRFADQFINIIAGEVTGFFKDFAGGIADAIRGVQSFGDVFKSIGSAITGVLSNILIKIGEVILEALILKAIQDALGGPASTAGAFISGLVGGTRAHSGAVVGAVGARGGTPISAPAAWFAAAPRYHSGGVVGLKPDEVPAILQRGEEVLSRNDPRNVMNGGGAGQAPQDIKIINAIDSRSVVTEGLNSPDGVKVLFNVIRANKSQFKQVLA